MFPEILVLGATSSVGIELINRLVQMGISPKAAALDVQKVSLLFKHHSLQCCGFDFTIDSSVEAALKGSEVIFLIPPTNPHMASYLKNTVRAARRQNIKHLVFLSTIGASNPAAGELGKWYGDAEQVVKTSEIPFTIIRVNCLMQNLIKFLQVESSTIALPFSRGAISFIDARDVAISGADIMLQRSHYGAKSFELTGPSALTMFEVAEILSSVLGKQVSYVSVPSDTAAYILEGKVKESQIDAVLEYFRFLGQGGADLVTNCVELIAGITPVAFIDFVRDYAQKIRQSTT